MNLFISKCARIINAITACLIITIGLFSAYLILGGNINISLDYENVRSEVYGMDYNEWKIKFQTPIK